MYYFRYNEYVKVLIIIKNNIFIQIPIVNGCFEYKILVVEQIHTQNISNVVKVNACIVYKIFLLLYCL